jgi:chromosome segregation ATPase
MLTVVCVYRCLQKEAVLGRCAAELGVDLAKNRVDLHRWRQRTALLKVRLSSAQEDVDRYRRMGELLNRQHELEVTTRRGSRAQAAALAQQVLKLAGRMRQQAAAIAGLQADLLRLQETVAARDRDIEQQQEAMVASSEQAQAELAEAQAGCRRLTEQLAAVQDRAAAADQVAVAAQVRFNSIICVNPMRRQPCVLRRLHG